MIIIPINKDKAIVALEKVGYTVHKDSAIVSGWVKDCSTKSKEKRWHAKEKAKTNSYIHTLGVKFDYLKSRDIHPEHFGKFDRQTRRSITPQGFAKAFYESNK